MVNMKTRMLANLLLGLMIAVSFAGCGKMQQDPLADKDAAVGDGTKEPEVEEGTKPTPSDFIRIDTVQFYSFEAGKADEFKIDGRIMVADYKLTFVLENLADFPGATFDSATGIFKWHPPKMAVVPPALSADFTLNVRAIAENTKQANQAVYTRSQAIPIKVYAKIDSPLIVSATPENQTIKENSNNNLLTIVVTDSMATADKATWPELTFFAASTGTGYQSLASFVNINTVSRNANTGEITYLVYLNLGNVELTNTTKKFELSMLATSVYGKASAERTITYSVTNQLGAASTTWLTTYAVKPGAKYDYTFIYYNKKSEGYINKPMFTGIPTGATITCSGTGSVQTCRFEWNVPATQVAATYTISAAVDTLAAQFSSEKVAASFSHFVLVVTTPAPDGE